MACLHRQGQFWHIFFTGGACLIAQDEKDTWTIHSEIPIGTDILNLDPKEVVYKNLGSSYAPYKIEIDEILVTSTFRPTICLANQYISDRGRVFLAGDAAHQNIPTGGYGMNTAVGDSFDIGWKLAAVLAGHAGPKLLRSYEEERRPVGARNIERSGAHAKIHITYRQLVRESLPDIISKGIEASQQLKNNIREWVLENDGENKDHGIELGYRYNGSSVIVADEEDTEPPYSVRHYAAHTWPGARAPHVFLTDGETSIFDLFGRGQEYTLVDFTGSSEYVTKFSPVAQQLNIPLKMVKLPNEAHIRKIWGRDAVLVRPDDHVAWRVPSVLSPDGIDVEKILLVAVGKQSNGSHQIVINGGSVNENVNSVVNEKGFCATIGNVDIGQIEMLGAFQR